ncbi:competence protein ComK [Bacillus sp. FJAT-47783]|uniref:competence protein ComK n=1 Tax=Bacillus sp. FJAT-47783 TaxID=2922712 RepID=UPI001FAB80DD|nr:competence protein ComK [Bacillus sp. FJAT-47783]
MKFMDKYILQRDTLALLPYFNEYGELYTTVIEKYHQFLVRKSPKQILIDNCHYHCSTLRGRIDAAKKVLPGHRMLPVCVSEYFKICFFPSKSMDVVDCQWFSHRGIKHIYPHKRGSIVVLLNDKKILVNKQSRFLSHKLKNATYLVYTLGVWQESLEQQNQISEDTPFYQDHEEMDEL